MPTKRKRLKNYRIGLVDADLLDNGTRHPNLVLLKIAGYLHDNGVFFELITTPDADISQYDLIYMSTVFTYTKKPKFYEMAYDKEKNQKFRCGGTGEYANETNVSRFKELRAADMYQLENDSFLRKLRNHRGGVRVHGIDMARQMPFYDLYMPFIEERIANGEKRDKYKDYLKYSIGFLTRGCYRHCPFCVNKLENNILPYSKLEWFRDEKRPHIYFWDDNFLAAPYEVWHPILQELIDKKITFQFRQGLDERQLAENEHGIEMAEMLSKAHYHGDYIFAFDNWRDRNTIERALKIWKRCCPKKGTKFYLFCGFKLTPEDDKRLYKDVWEIFARIHILMQYGCIGYIMRHEDYRNHELANIYVQIARWCNQPAFYKKMSFWEFCYRNQTFWEEHTLGRAVTPLKPYDEFVKDFEAGYYNTTKMCRPLKTFISFLERFKEHKEELLAMFNYKLSDLINPSLWENN
ncbi:MULTISPECIES: radical SAM protein [Bacteroidales]|uniref:Radical SAM protein n=1 Tax=Muribaculum intestinale TaxID=1796646 RepID=A0A1B1S9C0_9BACT|nr:MULTISPECIES: hypothetical protein [Bacteroidales]GFI68079.1 hypothetical protein IMSAG192_01618 [Muribaculaceae bacterium]ANU63400.1 hypothetical protein A4V02_06465 [Muribaculum intestinale]ASB38519.1 hypothetical protein ADH68_11280 [Muribaculum intestinale]PWB00082.1 hypothetical protein C5O29_12690 [Muribaculum intestinale]PWB06380.1 hypothetical protein C5O72_13555 [Muribaculum intestinale]